MSSTPFIAELDIGVPPNRFQLSSPTSSLATSRREIFVRWQQSTEASQILSIIEVVPPAPFESPTAGPNAPAREIERFLDLNRDFVLPLYAVPRNTNQDEWNIEVGYGQGTSRIDYPFRSREGAARFQSLITGYEPIAHFDRLGCVVTYQRGWQIPRPQFAGYGEIQLWREPEEGFAADAASPSGREEALLRIVDKNGPLFKAEKHLPTQDKVSLSAWNLAAVGRRRATSAFKILECTQLALNFGSCKDPANLEQRAFFQRQLLVLQCEYRAKWANQSINQKQEMQAQVREMREPVSMRKALRSLLSLSPSMPSLPEITAEPFVVDFETRGRASLVRARDLPIRRSSSRRP
ncbi:unnamed protein product [Parascedosporium putredinis]|uniref:Uncharacterized protein n=1 Tax=Parascedosporium putredinis TaxID=1442378 RepID=A0A9P1H8A0_9PEZI|nr:unnamed protein product [Parascedosporium putredinis]CAI8000592.1 unnamed protein product [Parascedosporium putredinis]